MSEAFELLPGIGTTLARRLREDLDVHSLTALAQAARDGRLDHMPGLGPVRAERLRKVLANRLMVDTHPPPIPVSLLLVLDEEFRRAEAAGELPRVPPPEDDPARGWRPVLHQRIDGRDVVVHWSDGPHARNVGRERDWVIVREAEGKDPHLFATIVTEQGGEFDGQRVVRGREGER